MSERRLLVRLDDVALLRQAHGGAEPDPVAAATLAGLAGAHGVAVHLREDRRHVQDRDARTLRQTVRSEFRLDIAPVPEMLKVALELRPDSAVLVPELPEDLSPGGGLDVTTELGALGEMVQALEDGKIRPGLLIRADLEQVKSAHRVGARFVQLCTERYSENGPDRAEEFERLRDSARLARKLGLRVGVGGGLDARRVRALRELPEVTEFCVGRALIARALLLGMDRAVGELVTLLD